MVIAILGPVIDHREHMSCKTGKIGGINGRTIMSDGMNSAVNWGINNDYAPAKAVQPLSGSWTGI